MRTLDQGWISTIMDMLEKHLGPNCEIVLHDLTKNIDNTVVDVRNGHVTGRRSDSASLGTEVLGIGPEESERCNYITHTRDLKILRSSSCFLRDGTGKVVAALCVHTDITSTVKFEHYLRQYNSYGVKEEDKNPRLSGIRQMMEFFLQEGQRLVGKPAEKMNREDKMTVLKYLDENGVFLVSKSSDRVCEYLGISRFTLYNYLDTVRSRASELARS